MQKKADYNITTKTYIIIQFYFRRPIQVQLSQVKNTEIDKPKINNNQSIWMYKKY